jgi:Nucleotide modification associated domain 2
LHRKSGRDFIVPKNYVYRIDHDTGFAPHIAYGLCTLCGCKATIERNAQDGSWVIGIGRNNTGKRNLLIYAMESKGICPMSDSRKGSLAGANTCRADAQTTPWC